MSYNCFQNCITYKYFDNEITAATEGVDDVLLKHLESLKVCFTSITWW